MNSDEVPDCCRECFNFSISYNEHRDIHSYYCELNTYLPTKKKSCKRQKIYSIKIGDVRDVSYEDAKKEIMAFIRDKKPENIHPSDIVSDLWLDIDVVFKVLGDLGLRMHV